MSKKGTEYSSISIQDGKKEAEAKKEQIKVERKGIKCGDIYHIYGKKINLEFKVKSDIYYLFDLKKYKAIVEVLIPADISEDEEAPIMKQYQKHIKFMDDILDSKWGLFDGFDKYRYHIIHRCFSDEKRAKKWAEKRKRNLTKQLIEILSKK